MQRWEVGANRIRIGGRCLVGARLGRFGRCPARTRPQSAGACLRRRKVWSSRPAPRFEHDPVQGNAKRRSTHKTKRHNHYRP